MGSPFPTSTYAISLSKIFCRFFWYGNADEPGRHTMTIELTKEDRAQAIASIQRYFENDMEEPIGNVAAGALLGFFLDEIGPTVYNKAVADVQERLQQRISELDLEVHEDEFQYWRKFERKPGSSK